MKTFTGLILPILLFLFSTTVLSQNFHAGPKVGVDFSQVDGDGYGGYHKAGLNLGAFVYRTIGKKQHWDLQFEIEYIQKGSRKTPNYDTGDLNDYKLTLNYIQMPLIARYNMRHVSLEGGLSLGTLLSSKEIFNDTEGGNPFKSMEFAMILGINYHFNPKLWINGRYTVSLARVREPYNGEIPVYDPNDLWDCRKPGQYNNVLVVSLYYAFGGQHKL